MSPPAHITLRNGTLEDLATLYEIERACFDEPVRFSVLEMQRLMKRGSVVVAEIEAVAIGFAIASIRGGTMRARLGYVDTIEVLPEHRGKGVADAMLTAVEDLFRRQGTAACLLHVAVGNAAAIRLYERRGYLRLNYVQRKFYPDGEDAFVMEKNLV